MTTLNYDLLSEETYAQIVLTAQEEANLVLDDIFGDDPEMIQNVLQTLCEENAVEYDSEEMYDLILDNEESLRAQYQPDLSSDEEIEDEETGEEE